MCQPSGPGFRLFFWWKKDRGFHSDCFDTFFGILPRKLGKRVPFWLIFFNHVLLGWSSTLGSAVKKHHYPGDSKWPFWDGENVTLFSRLWVTWITWIWGNFTPGTHLFSAIYRGTKGSIYNCFFGAHLEGCDSKWLFHSPPKMFGNQQKCLVTKDSPGFFFEGFQRWDRVTWVSSIPPIHCGSAFNLTFAPLRIGLKGGFGWVGLGSFSMFFWGGWLVLGEFRQTKSIFFIIVDLFWMHFFSEFWKIDWKRYISHLNMALIALTFCSMTSVFLLTTYLSDILYIHWVVVSNIFYFHPYLGKWSNLIIIFQMGWNHQLVHIVWGHQRVMMVFQRGPRLGEFHPPSLESWWVLELPWSIFERNPLQLDELWSKLIYLDLPVWVFKCFRC